MSDIFQKTTRGYEEVANRAHGLSPRLRRFLIMIDGKRSLSDLMELLPGDNFSVMVNALEMDGYIHLIGMSEGTSQRAVPSQTRVDLRMETTQQVDGYFLDSAPLFKDSNGQLRQPLSFKERQLRGSRVINELLGPNAEGIALRIEQCKDPESLEMILRMAAAFITDTINPVATQRFCDHVRLNYEP